jgi:hypothetical protein
MTTRLASRIGLGILILALGWLYVAGAVRHGAQVNVSRVRADQSGYLWDAVGIYQDRHAGTDRLIGERNRMPVYPWLLSRLYDPALNPDQFFEKAKRWNIGLSLVLLVVIGATARRLLSPLPALNLVLVAAFGFFVFKASYAQVELLFYTLWWLMFLACWLALTASGRRALMFGAVAGLLAAVAHLSKAALLPFAGLFIAVSAVHAAFVLLAAPRDGRRMTGAILLPVVFALTFLAVLSPYLLNSKRVFGHYFYNVNSTFYVWYDDWPAASQGTYQHGDGVGWPKMPASEIPSMRKYLREHSAGQIASRIKDGLAEMVVVSYNRLWYFKYVTLYLAFAALLFASRVRTVAAVAAGQPALAGFLVLYAITYALAVAFYKPISGTTLRMLLTHVLPLLFALSRAFAHPRLKGTQWSIGGMFVTSVHFHGFLLLTVLFDAAFTIWPRLMTDFAGY